VDWGGLPTASRRAPELREEVAVVFGALGVHGKGKRAEWEGLEPEELTVTKTGRGKGRKHRHLPL
jgi:hypothetical protein